MPLNQVARDAKSAAHDETSAGAQASEFSRGWKVLLACLIGVTAGFSSTYFYSSGFFLVPVAKELGVTRGQVSLSPLFCYLAAAVVAPVVGRAVDRFGPILIALTSMVGLALGFFLLAAFTTSLPTFVALSTLIAILGAGTTAVSFSRMIIATFRKHRGVAFGIMLTGPGVGAILMPTLLLPYLAEAGWRSAYQALGIVVLLAGAVIACILVPQRALVNAADTSLASSIGQAAPLREVWLSRPFLLLGGIFLLAALGVISVVVHFVPMLIDAGITAQSAAKLASSIGFAVIAGRLLTGYLLDRFEAERIALAMFALVVAGLALLAVGGSAMALPGAVISGLAVGAEIDLLAFLTARYFSVRSYGTAYGGVFGLFLLGGAIGPGATGLLYDLTGSYKVPLLCALACMAIACVLLYALRVGRNRWQRIQLSTRIGRFMKTLIQNVFVVSVDPAIGNIDGADILIEDGRIAAIRPGLANDVGVEHCECIDATGHIASPGFVDTHHHVWQSAVRGITADWSIRDYVSGIRLFVASCFRPEDMYAAQLGGMLQALRQGVTSTTDYCHNLNSPDHVEESIRGLKDSGARVVWSYGFNRPPLPNPAFASLEDRLDYLRRTAGRHFASKEGLLTLAASPEESWFWPEVDYGARQFRLARELGARIFWHANSTRNFFDGQPRRDVGQLIEQGLLGPDLTLVHMNHSQADEWQAVADAGAHVSITPETELQMNMGWPVIEETRRHGVNVGLGIDILSNNSADLRFQLRLLLQAGRRMLAQTESGKLDKGVPISCAEALYWGTLGGARALGLDHLTGSLTPGKAADILLHDARGISLVGWPRSSPEAALLLHAGADTLSDVMVAGRFVKRNHRLAVDEANASALLSATHDHLLARFAQQGGLAAAMDKPIGRYAADGDSASGRVIRV